MTLLFKAEWLRFSRNRSNLVVLLVLLAVLTAGALWSGLAAREYREQLAVTVADGVQARVRLAAASQTQPVDLRKDAGAAYALARDGAGAAVLPPLGGLVLSVNRFQVLHPELRPGVDTRYLDGRKGDALVNPLLEALGMLDFATLVAIFLPLAILGLAYGLVQEDKEQGTWRLSCAQSRSPWRILAAALLLRWLVVVVVAALVSALAFALDPGATFAALVSWWLLVLAFSAVWIGLAGLFCALPVSAGAAAVGLLGTWLLSSFAVPALLAHGARQEEPMPSRLAAIAAMRHIQQEGEEETAELLAAWYRNHPGLEPATIRVHARPVDVVPRYLWQDRQFRSLQADFDQARSAQFDTLAGWSWSAPGLALLMSADALAGIDAPRYQRYMEAVNGFEDRWRAALVPTIMGYRRLDPQQLQALPRFAMPVEDEVLPSSFALSRSLSMATFAALCAAALLLLRKKFTQP